MFTNFGYVNAADARENMVQAGADVVFADQGVTAVFLDTTLMEIEAVTITV